MKYLCSRGFEILRFAQDDKYAVLYCLVILNAVKNLGSCGFEFPRRSRSVGMTDMRLSLCFPETHTRRITYQPKWRFQFLPFSFHLSAFSFPKVAPSSATLRSATELAIVAILCITCKGSCQYPGSLNLHHRHYRRCVKFFFRFFLFHWLFIVFIYKGYLSSSALLRMTDTRISTVLSF